VYNNIVKMQNTKMFKNVNRMYIVINVTGITAALIFVFGDIS